MTGSRRLTFRNATARDAAAIAGLQNAAAGALTARFGDGHWSSLVSERGVAVSLRHARVRLGRSGKRVLTVLRLVYYEILLDSADSSPPLGSGQAQSLPRTAGPSLRSG